MAGRAAAPLQGGSDHRVPDVANIQRRAEFLRLFGCQPFVVHPVGTVRMDMALGDLFVVNRVGQHHDATRRKHDVVVELLGEVFPHLQCVVVKRRTFVKQVVRTDDGGVAAGIAAPDPALFNDGNVSEAVFLCQVVGRAEAVTAAADDDRVVAGLSAFPACATGASNRAGPTGRASRSDRAENRCMVRRYLMVERAAES